MSPLAFESKDDAVLVVDANGLMPDAITFERMKSVAWRHPQVIELRYRVDLIQLARTTGHNAFGIRRAALLFTPCHMSRVVSSANDRIIQWHYSTRSVLADWVSRPSTAHRALHGGAIADGGGVQPPRALAT